MSLDSYTIFLEFCKDAAILTLTINSIPKGVPPDYEVCDHQIKGEIGSKSAVCGLVKHYFYEEVA